MRAAILTHQAPVEDRPVRIAEIDRPVPNEDEVLVRVIACGLCRTDLHVVEGDLALHTTPIVVGHQVVGEVVAGDRDGRGPPPGRRVGIAWLGNTCRTCRFCASLRENLCLEPQFTGWTRQGGFAEYITAPSDFVYELDDALDSVHAAPLLCAGIIGFRCLAQTGLERRGFAGARLGIYGFGAAGHIVIQLARARGARVFVCTRDETRHRALARELGAQWVGGSAETPPEPLDAAIIFAPAGELVPPALAALDRGGVLVLGGIHMSPIPSLDYARLYHERSIVTVANNTRDDGVRFLAEAARLGVNTSVRRYPLERVADAMIDLKHDAIAGAAVIEVGGP